MTIKIVGAGFGRTGTLSLKMALEQLGFEKCYHMMEVGQHPDHVQLWADAHRGICNAFEKTDDSLTVDLSTHYALSEKIDLYGKIENITGEEDILGRQPYGARPNKYRTATLGVRIDF